MSIDLPAPTLYGILFIPLLFALRLSYIRLKAKIRSALHKALFALLSLLAAYGYFTLAGFAAGLLLSGSVKDTMIAACYATTIVLAMLLALAGVLLVVLLLAWLLRKRKPS